MSTDSLFCAVADAEGWTPEMQIDALLRYVGNQESPETFRDFLDEYADQVRQTPRPARPKLPGKPIG